jgi:tetratricopeptide (TPR) repeat protein
MIVRDEEHHLEACLHSIRDLVDEMVVVDTGSTDGTVALARRMGARVHSYPWHDDFAAARNHGLELCRGGWILYIDADERARPHSRAALEEKLADPTIVGLSVLLHARTGYTAYPEMRLFRSDPRIRFQGLMHETIWPGIARYLEEEGGEIRESGLVLDHVGYDGPQERKHRRNLPLLEKALEADPEHVYCWYHLGMVHHGLGDPEQARRAWRAGVEAVRRKLRLWATDCLPFVELIHDGLAQGVDVRALLDEALELFPDEAQLLWLRGHEAMQGDRLEEAIEAFEELLARSEAGQIGDQLGFDRRQFSSATYAAMAGCCYRLGRYDEAARYFALAERHDPHTLEYRVKRQLCEHLLRTRSS